MGAKNKISNIKKENNDIILMGFCCFSTNGKGLLGSEQSINVLDPKKIEKLIDEINIKGQLLMISGHWGQEHVYYPNYDHIEVARKLSKDRKLIIHGHHPHVIQGLEKIDDNLIVYSLGNFCFDDVYTNKSDKPLVKLSKANRESFILGLEIINNKVITCEIIPFSFEYSSYKIKSELVENIQERSKFLNEQEDVYNQTRNIDLSNYIDGRKKLEI